MEEEYDWDIYDMFREQLELQIPTIETNILLLDKHDSYLDATDEVFRTYHSYKATSSYLRLTPFNELVSKAETVLSSLRDSKKIVSESIIEWLLLSVDQLNIWQTEMQKNETNLSPALNDLNKNVNITSLYLSPKEKLKKLTILYIDKNEKRGEKICSFLNKIVHDVRYESNIDDAKNLVEHFKYNILMLNLNKDNYELIDLSKTAHINKPIIAVFDKISTLTQKKLLKLGINHAITNPLNAKDIQRELHYLTKTYFNSANVIINNKKIADFIQTLKPLPNTIFQIMQVCDDEELPIKELVKVVKSDPIIAANILQAANSPLYGSTELKTIDQAISRLGKTAIKALTVKDIYKNLGDLDLTPYNIDEKVFSEVSMTRLSLMLKWYSKVSIADLSILSSTALLGNIGQLLLSKEIMELNDVDYFKELYNAIDIQYAEEKLLHTHTNLISAQILNYWRLSPDIVNVITYSDKPEEASEELKKLIIANNIVYSLVPLNGVIKKELPDDVLVLMQENNLDTVPLINALNFILTL